MLCFRSPEGPTLFGDCIRDEKPKLLKELGDNSTLQAK